MLDAMLCFALCCHALILLMLFATAFAATILNDTRAALDMFAIDAMP